MQALYQMYVLHNDFSTKKKKKVHKIEIWMSIDFLWIQLLFPNL